MKDYVEIKNATIHNLKGIDVKIPKNKLTIITGLSPTVAGKNLQTLNTKKF